MLSACASTADPIDERQQAITSGTPASDAAVVALVQRRTSCSGPPPTIECSGSVIAERVVLTAAHCVAAGARGRFEVFFGTSPGAPGGEYRGIVAHRIHPLYDRQFDDNDVALVWLDARAPVASVPLISGTLDPASVGQNARLVGFGHTAAGDASRAEKLTGPVLLSGLGDATVAFGPAPAMTCDGDSGGPVLVDTGAGEVLAAVITSGDRECRTAGVAARIDVQLAGFIEPALAGAAPSASAGAGAEQVCIATCSDDSECPHDLVCRADLDGTDRCLLPDLPTGAFETNCQSDAECVSGSCVPLGAECRCLRPCAADLDDPARPRASGGCALSAPARRPTSWLMAVLFGAVITLRARRSSV